MAILTEYSLLSFVSLVAVLKYKFGLEVVHKTKGEEKPQNDENSITEDCRNLAHEYIKAGYDPNTVMDDLAACLEGRLSDVFQKHRTTDPAPKESFALFQIQ